MEYINLTVTEPISIADGIVTFCPHFKYFGPWISFSLKDDYGVTSNQYSYQRLRGGYQ